MEANYFTTLQWVLSYTDMNQPWSYMYSHLDPPSHLPVHPIPLGLHINCLKKESLFSFLETPKRSLKEQKSLLRGLLISFSSVFFFDIGFPPGSLAGSLPPTPEEAFRRWNSSQRLPPPTLSFAQSGLGRSHAPSY